MRKLFLALALVMIFGCKPSTEYGECIGFDDDKKPELVYNVSVRNAFWSVVGIQFILPPIWWAVDFVYCPVGEK